MTTTVKNLGAVAVRYGTALPSPRVFHVTRKGVPGPSIWRDFGSPIITTLAEVKANVPADSFGNAFWGREGIVRGNMRKKFIFSNDVQAFYWDGLVNATEEDPETLYMTVVDAADVDRTGSTFSFNGKEITIPFGPNGRKHTFEIKTTDKVVRFKVDSGTMPGMPKAPAHPVADGVAITLPCLKLL